MRAKLVGLCMGLMACSAEDGGRSLDGLQAYPGPQFPGAGNSGSGVGIAAGAPALGCDAPLPFGGRPAGPATLTCFYGGDATPAATVEWIVESDPQGDLVHVRLTLNPAFVDNTYGAHAIGWDAKGPDKMPGMGKMPGKMPGMGPGKAGHTFKDLLGSDHAEFKLRDASGALRLHFKADYISETPTGYASLGVHGGDGKMIAGNANDVVAVQSSLERNLGACGLGDFTVDSPATDSVYTPNALARNWDYRVVYDVWVRAGAFANVGFGAASVDFVHASPSKQDGATVEVTPGECPPGWPPYCEDPNGCPCLALDGYCGGPGTPPKEPCVGEDCPITY